MDEPDLFGDAVRLAMLDDFQGLPLQRQCSVDSNNAQRLQLPKNPNEDQIKMKPDPDIGDLLWQAYTGENVEKASACRENDVQHANG